MNMVFNKEKHADRILKSFESIANRFSKIHSDAVIAARVESDLKSLKNDIRDFAMQHGHDDEVVSKSKTLLYKIEVGFYKHALLYL